MTNLLLRLFVKNYRDTKNPKVRAAYGKLAGAVGIVCNLQREGIDSKKARGEWDDYGRPAVMPIDEFSEHYQKVVSGEIRPFELMKQLGMSKSTYYRYIKKIPTMTRLYK